MKINNLIKIGVLSVLLGFAFSSHAQEAEEDRNAAQRLRESVPEVRPVETNEELQPHAAIIAGVSNPEGSFNTGAEYGIDVGLQPVIPFGLGLEISQANYDGDAYDLTRSNFMLKGSYNFAGDIVVLRDSYVGLGIGALIEDAGPSTTTYGGFMPNLGFDIPTFQVNERWVSLGATARYLLTASDSPDVFAVNGVLKYWF